MNCPAVFAPPQPYTPGYSFADYQALHPSAPLPAQRLDIELAAIRTAIQGLACALQRLQRGDGALANGLVTRDALSPLLLAALGLPPLPPAVIVSQVKIALSYAGAVGAVERTISASPDDPTNILWSTGGPTVPNDLIWTAIQAAIGWNSAQMATLYARAARLTTLVVAGAVEVSALKRSIAANATAGTVGAVDRQIPNDPNNPATILWTTGGLTSPGDALGQFLSAIGLPVATLYAAAGSP